MDLENEVDSEEAWALAKKYKMWYFETSAKTGEGVKEVFDYIAWEILKDMDEDWEDTIKISRVESERSE